MLNRFSKIIFLVTSIAIPAVANEPADVWQKDELDAFKEEMRTMTIVQMAAVLKGNSTDLIKHLGTQTSDELYKRESKMRAESVMRHFMMGDEDAKSAMPD